MQVRNFGWLLAVQPETVVVLARREAGSIEGPERPATLA